MQVQGELDDDEKTHGLSLYKCVSGGWSRQRTPPKVKNNSLSFQKTRVTLVTECSSDPVLYLVNLCMARQRSAPGSFVDKLKVVFVMPIETTNLPA